MKGVDQVRDILFEVKNLLEMEYGDKIKKIIVYGSYARGEATDDSDLDIAIVTDDNVSASEIEGALDDLLFRILLEKGELVSVMAISEGVFNTYNSPFLLNVKEQGAAV